MTTTTPAKVKRLTVNLPGAIVTYPASVPTQTKAEVLVVLRAFGEAIEATQKNMDRTPPQSPAHKSTNEVCNDHR